MKFDDIIEKLSAKKIEKEELFDDEKEQFMVTDDKFDDFKKFKEYLIKNSATKNKGKIKDTEFAFHVIDKIQFHLGKVKDDYAYISTPDRKSLEELLQRYSDSSPSSQLSKNSKVTLEFLKSHLWTAADILRGSLDPSEYRQPVMTLLFLKRLNDRFEENVEQLFKEGKSQKEIKQEFRHNFFVPDEARWEKLAVVRSKVGEKIDEICKIVEKANPKLEGVLTNTKYADPRKYPDDKLANLISHFNSPRLRNSDLEKDGRCAFAGYLIRFVPDNSKLIPSYLSQITHSVFYWKWLKSIQTWGVQPNVNAEQYSNMPIMLPSIQEQQKITLILSNVDSQIQKEQETKFYLEILKKGLMQKLLTGQIRVKT